MLPTLTTLACFKHIDSVIPIFTGLSSQCYQVNADKKRFFAKKTLSSDEAMVCKGAALKNISPMVVYHDQYWLITLFIDGISLALNQQAINDKITTSTQLMAQCHQLKIQPSLLIPTKIADDLIWQQSCSVQQKNTLLAYSQALISPLHIITPKQSLVCCHGDLNFSNVIIDPQHKAWLIDYECACLAPAAYDLAMFIAVNNISKDSIATVVKYYQQQSFAVIDEILVNDYVKFCFFINGLWYIQAYNKTGLPQFIADAKMQWHNIALDIHMLIVD